LKALRTLAIPAAYVHPSYIHGIHGTTSGQIGCFNNECTVNQPESFHVGFQ